MTGLLERERSEKFGSMGGRGRYGRREGEWSGGGGMGVQLRQDTHNTHLLTQFTSALHSGRSARPAN